MKKSIFLILLLTSAGNLLAHDHIEIGLDPVDSTRLATHGPAYQLSTYFPLGESPSLYLTSFPGGFYAAELTFSVAGDVLEIPDAPTQVAMELVSVTGPAGANFAFWEVNSTSPTWSRATGWTASSGDQPSFAVSESGGAYGHIHGRVLTVDRAGTYDVTFRAVDTSGTLLSGETHTIRLNAIQPPQLSIRFESNLLKLSFTSRLNLSYDLQSSTTLGSEDWTTIETLSGTGELLEFTESLDGRPRIFYRLVEFQ